MIIIVVIVKENPNDNSNDNDDEGAAIMVYNEYDKGLLYPIKKREYYHSFPIIMNASYLYV